MNVTCTDASPSSATDALDVLSEQMHGDGGFTFRLSPDAHLALAKLNGTAQS